MENIVDLLKRAAEKSGFRRERYVEKNIPTTTSNMVVLPFYGDTRSEFVLSSLLLHRINQKYLILCSYPGRDGIYPYVDEYWSLQDETMIKSLSDLSTGMKSDENKIVFQERQLNRYFENVINISSFEKFYNRGFTTQFFDELKSVVYYLPSIPSSKIEFNRSLAQKSGFKVFLSPSRKALAWSRGKEVKIDIKIDFWLELIEKMIKRGLVPVVCHDFSTFDISREMERKCVYVSENKILDVLGAMRTTGCVLDVFNGTSRFACMARTPFLACIERHLYNEVKEYEIDALCCNKLPHKYIFSFPTIIESRNWDELIENIVNKLESFLPELNRDEWASTAEQLVTLPYSLVKEKKRNKIGTRFIKVERV